MTVIHSQPSGYFNNDGTFQQFEETNQNPSDSHITVIYCDKNQVRIVIDSFKMC